MLVANANSALNVPSAILFSIQMLSTQKYPLLYKEHSNIPQWREKRSVHGMYCTLLSDYISTILQFHILKMWKLALHNSTADDDDTKWKWLGTIPK